jgi:two-component system KDP operon response regulator KdpE
VSDVLVVDDEPQLLRALRITLTASGYEVHTAATGLRALAEATTRPPDLVILDLGLPDIDGAEVIDRLRAHSAVPIIVLSGRTSGADKVPALDAGADDYITKPFGIEELLARIRAVTRRTAGDDGAVAVDLGARRVSSRTGGDVRLTPTEWRLLDALVRHPGKLIGRQQLITEVWGPVGAEDSSSLRFYLNRLRRKLEPDPSRPRYLLTEPGLGYRFQPPR